MHRRLLLRSTRRMVLVAGTGFLVSPARADGGFLDFVASLKAEAAASGISRPTIDTALMISSPDQRVLALDRHQPEFTLTWSEYRARVLPQARLVRAAAAFSARKEVFSQVEDRFAVDSGVIVGIWGLESSFGEKQGNFNICEALTTLAYDGRRRSFFRAELMNALSIIDRRGISARELTGSYAGAMGQPQFMPSAYLRFATSFSGGDRADIWRSEPDVFASIANYLARSGWRLNEPWGQPVHVTRPISVSLLGHDKRRRLLEWSALGVKRSDGRNFSRADVVGGLLMPDGEGGDAFMVYRNFDVIRRYNPSDFYALGVGLLGDQIG